MSPLNPIIVGKKANCFQELFYFYPQLYKHTTFLTFTTFSMSVNRRKFLQSSALAGAGLAIPTAASATATSANILSEKPKSKINVGVIGSGFRGQGHIDLLLRRSDCEVTVVAEIDERMLAYTRKIFEKAGKKQPKYFTNGERDYLNLLQHPDLDAVMIATPWKWH